MLTFDTKFVCLNEWHAPTESASKLASSEFDELSAPPGAPIYTTGTTTSTWPTIVTTRTKRRSFSANNPNFESKLKQRVSFDNTGGSGSLATTRSVSQGMSSNLSSDPNFETVLP